MKYFGAHVSTQGGLFNAPANARAIGATAFALFTKNQRQWDAHALTQDDIGSFKKSCEANGYQAKQILPHDSYLINLGQPDDAKRDNAVKAFTLELERCRQLGLTMLNFHPGSSLKAISESVCIGRIARSVRENRLHVIGLADDAVRNRPAPLAHVRDGHFDRSV